MSDIDWNVVHETLWGHPAGTPEPEIHNLYREIQKGLDLAAQRQGKPFGRQIIIEAHKAKLDKSYYQYLFFVIIEQRRNWPNMPQKEKQALTIARDIMTQFGTTPNYYDNLKIPPRSEELKITLIIHKLAFWCRSTMASELLGVYIKLLKQQSVEYLKLYPGVPPQKVFARLKFLFEKALHETPRIFIDPYITQAIVRNLF